MRQHKTGVESLPYQINHCANLLHRSHHVGRGEKGGPQGGPGQGRLLGLLMQKDGMPQKELVDEMDIRPSSLGELVDKLEQAGFVQRRQDETDKRVSRVFLTDAGRARAQQSEAARQQRFEERFSGLSAEEQEQLLALMQKLNAHLEESLKDAGAGESFHGPAGHCEHAGHHGPHGMHRPRGPHGPRDEGEK